MPKFTLGLAFTYLFFLLATLVVIYVIFIYPLMKHSYNMLTTQTVPNFFQSLIQRYGSKKEVKIDYNMK